MRILLPVVLSLVCWWSLCGQGLRFNSVAFMGNVTNVDNLTVGDSVPPTNVFLRSDLNPMSVPSETLVENIWYSSESNSWYGVASAAGAQSSIIVLRNTNNSPGNPVSWVRYGAGGIVTNTGANAAPHMFYSNNGYYYCFFGLDDGNLYCASNNVLTNLFSNSNSLAKLVLSKGTGSQWDSVRVMEPYVWLETTGPYGGQYCMLYMGAYPAANNEQVGLATCSTIDGTYVKNTNNPILRWGNVGAYDHFTVADPWQIKWNDTWYIGYSANAVNGAPWGTGYASTKDWVTFTKLGLMFPTNSTEGNCFRGALTRIGDYYVLPYTRGTYQSAIAMAQARKIPPAPTSIVAAATVWSNATTITFNTTSNAFCSCGIGTSPGVYPTTYSDAITTSTNTHQFNITNTTQGTIYYYSIWATNTVYPETYANVTGSFVQPAASASPFWPTNSQIGAAFWWEPALGYTTNSGVATLANLGSAGAAYNLTNQGAAGGFPKQGPALNGLNTLFFNQTPGNWLENTVYTSGVPCEIFFVAAITNVGTQYILDSDNSSYRQGFYIVTDILVAYAGGPSDIAQAVYNKWCVFDIIIDGNSCCDYGYTNGVATAARSSTAAGASGLSLGAQIGKTAPGTFSIGTLFILTNTTAGPTAWSTTRSNAYYYCTNRFALTLP